MSRQRTVTYSEVFASVVRAVDKVAASDVAAQGDREAAHEAEDVAAQLVIEYVAKYADPASKALAEQMMRIYANDDRVRWYA